MGAEPPSVADGNAQRFSAKARQLQWLHIQFYRAVWRLAPLIGYKARLRVRIGNALTTDETRLIVTLGGRRVAISGEDRKKPLREAKWVIFTVKGFRRKSAAQAYGERLRNIVELAGLSVRNGVDIGNDKPSSWIDEEWARGIGLIRPSEKIFPNVHGLHIVPNSKHVKFPSFHAEGIVTSSPKQLIESLIALDASLNLQSVKTGNGVRLLNIAIMTQQPVAKMVLAISAIEELGQTENWTIGQRSCLNHLAQEIKAGKLAGHLAQPDREEVADALLKSVHRLGLRQGVVRILRELGLGGLIKDWDRLYGLRSGIVHGTAKLSEAEQSEIANQVVSLCGRILITILENEGVVMPSIANIHYPTLPETRRP